MGQKNNQYVVKLTGLIAKKDLLPSVHKYTARPVKLGTTSRCKSDRGRGQTAS